MAEKIYAGGDLYIRGEISSFQLTLSGGADQCFNNTTPGDPRTPDENTHTVFFTNQSAINSITVGKSDVDGVTKGTVRIQPGQSIGLPFVFGALKNIYLKGTGADTCLIAQVG